MSRYSNLRDTYARLFYGGTPTPDEYADIEARIARNAELPKNLVAMRGVAARMKPEADILAELADFQSEFMEAVQQEIDLGLASKERLRTLEYAMKSPTMNLQVISNTEVRRRLDDQFQSIMRGTRSFSKLWITISIRSFWKPQKSNRIHEHCWRWWSFRCFI